MKPRERQPPFSIQCRKTNLPEETVGRQYKRLVIVFHPTFNGLAVIITA